VLTYSIRVPATSANLGPGFDALGLALSTYNRFYVHEAEKTSVIGCDPQYAGPSNLFLVAFREACSRLGTNTPEIDLEIDATIPLARGLGSSAAMSVAGAAAAILLRGDVKNQERKGNFSLAEKRFILDAAAAMEGHPDNAVPAVFGGFCVSSARPGGCIFSRCEVPAEWRFHALVPPFELSTADARAALPKLVPLADAAFNAGGAALMALAFARNDPGLIRDACEDRLHQPYRKHLIPGYAKVTEACSRLGARGVWLSGAGPTVMALTSSRREDEEFRKGIDPVLESMEEGLWRRISLQADLHGVSCMAD
jgi:homoserine kinase